MKSHRSIGPIKTPRIPLSTLTTERLSALEAFERWQRESLRAGTVTSTEDSQKDHDQPVKN